MMALAAHGAPHVEASHPREAELMHATDLRPWSAALRSPAQRIARRSGLALGLGLGLGLG